MRNIIHFNTLANQVNPLTIIQSFRLQYYITPCEIFGHV
jgi:hypothetical protein